MSNEFVHPHCLEGLEILRKHNLVFLNTPQVDIFAAFCQPSSGVLPSNDGQKQHQTQTQQQTDEEAKETLSSNELIKSWQSDKVRFDANTGRLVSLDLGGRRLHRGLACDPSVFGKFQDLKTLSLAGTDLPLKDILAVLGAVFASGDGGDADNDNDNDNDKTRTGTGTGPALESLYLGGNGLGSVGAEAIASSEWFLPSGNRRSKLTKLDLRYNDIGSAGMAAICRAMMGNSNESSSSSSNNNSNSNTMDDSTTTLETETAQAKNLQHLYMEGNAIGDEGCEVLAELLSSSTCNLREIYLGANTIGPSGARALAGCLSLNQQQHRSKNNNNTLFKLYLEGNSLGPEGALAFCEALEDLRSKGVASSLRHLYVDNNQVGKEVSNRLAKALRSETAIPDVCG